MANSSSDGVSTATFGAANSGDDLNAAPAAADSARDTASVDDASSDSATRGTTIYETTYVERVRRDTSEGSGPSGAVGTPSVSESAVNGHITGPPNTFAQNWNSNGILLETPPGTPPGSARSYGPARPVPTSSLRRPSTTPPPNERAAIPSDAPPEKTKETYFVGGADAKLDAS